MTKVFAITGIPGTGIQTALDRMAEFLQSQDPPATAKVISIDENLWKVFCRHVEKKPSLLQITGIPESRVNPEGNPDWWKLLSLPIQVIRELWSEAAEETLKELSNLQNRGTEENSKELVVDFILVTFHASYYSDTYSWTVCPVNPYILPKFAFESFITFVDDSYDIHKRRIDDAKAITENVKRNEGNAGEKLSLLVTLTLKKMGEYIGWRQAEVILTDLFASALKVPSSIFAIKHPKETLWKLLNNPRESTYFSHPISAVRRKCNANDLSVPFSDVELYREITELAEFLRWNQTLIEPTTIDELRIKTVEVDEPREAGGTEKRLYLLPQLTDRWPLLDDPNELVYADRVSIGGGNSIISSQTLSELNLTEEWELLTAGKSAASIQKGVALQVTHLSNLISQDISWRDHHLVDQTKKLIVFRPTSDGKASRGVQREIEYFRKVRQTVDNTKAGIVYHPPDERSACAKFSASQLLVDLRTDSATKALLSAGFAQLNEAQKDRLERKVEELIYEIKDLDDVSYKIALSLKEYTDNLAYRLGENAGALEPGPTSTFLGSDSEIEEIFVKTVKKILSTGNHYIEAIRPDRMGLVFVDNLKTLRKKSADPRFA